MHILIIHNTSYFIVEFHSNSRITLYWIAGSNLCELELRDTNLKHCETQKLIKQYINIPGL